jgi:hypothetical protein
MMPSAAPKQIQARQPRGVSPWFAVALISAFTGGLLVFFIAVRHHAAPQPTPPALRDARAVTNPGSKR